MPSNTPLAELYRTMRRIRTFEERLLDNPTEGVDVGSKAELSESWLLLEVN